MNKWNLIVDVAECHNCNNCVIGCKDEHIGNDIKGYAAPQPLHGHKWIDIITRERGRFPTVDVTYVPVMCNQCDDAPCIKQGGGAVTKRDDGIVIIDPEKAVDRKDIVDSCPYGAIWWNEDLRIPQKWIFDAHLLDRGWKAPRCVQSCPTGAMKALKISDEEMAAIIDAEKLQPIRPDFDTKPRVFYKNLHRYNTVFVAGDVLVSAAGVLDCAANASVRLLAQGKERATTQTDEFGDFRIDGLEPASGAYELQISLPGFSAETTKVELGAESVVLPSVVLQSGA